MQRFSFVFAILLFVATSAMAQSSAQSGGTLINATVVKFDSQNLTVKTDKGMELSATVPATARLFRAKPGTIADVKSGQYIHSMTVDEPNGKWRALTIGILPDASATGVMDIVHGQADPI